MRASSEEGEVPESTWPGLLPPLVEGGTGHYGSRGSWIDRLMGDRSIRKAAEQEIEALVAASGEGEPQPAPPPEPPPVVLPPAVPDGTGTETKPASLIRMGPLEDD